MYNERVTNTFSAKIGKKNFTEVCACVCVCEK